ncbi:helix-turn-helix transcriptional regulator [bacterium]|nr:helix-turn-helix transcriptional regulator [bacterium]
MTAKELLGAKIRYLRKSRKIAQEKLSEMAEISPRQMVRIEMGQSFPTIDNLEKIASALGVSIQSLFENDYYDKSDNLKQKLYDKIDTLDDKNTRFLYIVASHLD